MTITGCAHTGVPAARAFGDPADSACGAPSSTCADAAAGQAVRDGRYVDFASSRGVTNRVGNGLTPFTDGPGDGAGGLAGSAPLGFADAGAPDHNPATRAADAIAATNRLGRADRRVPPCPNMPTPFRETTGTPRRVVERAPP
ncbi:hypothetical protein [Micromonospora carbonacea]|uniref:hypothetical protein n=1 Tax=Micromonospora carbonacea TaxID=47853 RepID=UPI0037206954